ncbi:MAG: polymer-forming cytoskeletal protein, partial [Pygmaiobacter sp.]
MGEKDNFSNAGKELLNPVEDAVASTKELPSAKHVETRAISTDCPRLTTSISEDTVLIGAIRGKGDLDLKGQVKGNVSVQGDLRVQGKIVGNVEGGSIVMSGSAIKGDVDSKGTLTMDSKSVVLGNIHAEDI